MSRRECPDCERVFSGPLCPACGWQEPQEKRAATWTPPPGPPPCTREQNAKAAQVLREVTLKLLTIDQALARLGEIFGAEAVAESRL